MTALVVTFAVAVALSLWATRLARRGGWRRSLRFAPALCVFAWLGTLVSWLLLARTFEETAAPGASPAARQEILSRGIAHAAWPTAIEVAVFALLFLVLVVAELTGSAPGDS